MKILALGDVHLGAGTDLGRVPFGRGSRLDDQDRVLARITALATDKGCDLILFAGDAFHRRRPTPSEILVWKAFVEETNEHGVEIIACDGNHDVESAERPSALELVKQHQGYQVSRTPGLFHPTPQIVVATLPWTPPARLLASLNGDVARDEVNARVAELLIDTARDLRAQIPEGKTAILLAHWCVSGSSLPNGLPVDQLRETVLSLPDLEALGFDAVVLGHIHRGQVLTAEFGGGSVFYVGSPAVVDFGETRIEHGVWTLDTEDNLRPRFHEIDDRAFVTVDVELNGDPSLVVLYDDETDCVAGEIMAQTAGKLADAVVRVRYRCTPDQARRVDVAAIRDLLADAGVAKIHQLTPVIEREDRAGVAELDESLSVLDAVDLWIGSKGLSPEKAEELRRQTARYLEALT